MFACLLFVLLCIVPTASARAEARLYFDPTSIQVTQDTTYEIRIMIDVGSVETVGAGAMVIYNKDAFTIQSVTSGGFYPKFESEINTSGGRINIHGLIDTINSKKTGSGVFANIAISPKSSIQSEPIVFQCISGESDTAILDGQGHNILSCSGTNIVSITSGTSQPSPTKKTTPVPTAAYNQVVSPTMTPNPTLAADRAVSSSLPSSFPAQTAMPESMNVDRQYNDAAPTQSSSDTSSVDPFIYVLGAFFVAAASVGIGYAVIRKIRSRNEIVRNFTQSSEPPPPQPAPPSVPLADDSQRTL